MCAFMFIAALFTKAKIWKQCKSPSLDDQIKGIVRYIIYIFNTSIKKDEVLPLRHINEPRGHYAKWNESENDKYRMISYVESKQTKANQK